MTRGKVFVKPETIFWSYGFREFATKEPCPNYIVVDLETGKEKLYWELDETTLTWNQKRELAIALAQVENVRVETLLVEGLKIESCHVSIVPKEEESVEQFQSILKKLQSHPDLSLKLTAIEAYTIAASLRAALDRSLIYGESAAIAQKAITEIKSQLQI